jgi:hypothetical protein
VPLSRNRRVIKGKPFLNEKIRSLIGIAVARDRGDTLLQNFIALARKLVKQ